MHRPVEETPCQCRIIFSDARLARFVSCFQVVLLLEAMHCRKTCARRTAVVCGSGWSVSHASRDRQIVTKIIDWSIVSRPAAI